MPYKIRITNGTAPIRNHCVSDPLYQYLSYSVMIMKRDLKTCPNDLASVLLDFCTVLTSTPCLPGLSTKASVSV